MHRPRIWPLGLLALALALAAPAPAAAQFGGLKGRIKEKIKDKIGGDDASAGDVASGGGRGGRVGRVRGAATAQTGVVFNESMLEMTPEVLDRLEKAFAAEKGAATAVKKTVPRVDPEVYDACRQRVGTGPEMQEVAEKYAQHARGLKGEAAAEQTRAYLRAVNELIARKCGPDPNTAEEQRMRQNRSPQEVALEASGFTAIQLAILKERLAPFCAAAVTAEDGELKLPGGGQGIYWVYSPAEVAALQGRCARLGPYLQTGA